MDIEKKFAINSDTYLFYIESKKWVKLDPSGTTPSPRAAHASCCLNINQIVIYGGTTGSGGLASDNLYLLDFKNGEHQAKWIVLPVTGTTPGRRYGHTMVFFKPYLILFGGNNGNEDLNDVWILSAKNHHFQWQKLEITGDVPPNRIYHSAAVCNYGTANGMMLTFGGRGKEGNLLNDMWGLRRHKNGIWDWIKAPYKENPKERVQHSSIFCGKFFINLGGRSLADKENLPIEVYDTETCKWHVFQSFRRCRHAIFIVDAIIYIHGGLEQCKHNDQASSLSEINLLELFDKESLINLKLEVKNNLVHKKNLEKEKVYNILV